MYETAEKKFELVLPPGGPSLRALGASFWEDAVGRAGAAVLSRAEGPRGDACLLSESSLFVWDRRAVMITCGRTRLVDALEPLLDQFGPPAELVYQRSVEAEPERQPTTFEQDAERLGAAVDAAVLRLGPLSVLQAGPARSPRFELRMQRLGGSGTELGRLLPGFLEQRHRFSPAGLSINGMRGSRWYALHVAPEPPASFASFASDLPPEGLEPVLDRLLGSLRPGRIEAASFGRPLPEGFLGRPRTGRVGTRLAGAPAEFARFAPAVPA